MITELNLTTPALLFPAISLLLLAYTNRFVVLAKLARELDERYRTKPARRVMLQIKNLHRRIVIIQYMQVFGVASFFSCVLCMFLLFQHQSSAAEWVFGSALVLLMISLFLSLIELHISVNALKLQLDQLPDSTNKSGDHS